MGAFIALFVLYDPLTTSMAGGALGHLALGLRVRKESSEDGKISVFAALLRFAVKSLLGWISLITVIGNKWKRAIHDMISDSVVTFKRKAQPYPSAVTTSKLE